MYKKAVSKAVMRNFIIALSILFFALSGFIKMKESSISAPETVSPNERTDVISRGVLPEVEEALGKLTKEQEESRAQVRKLQDMVAGLEERLALEVKEKQEQAAARRAEKKARVLAVLGDGVFDTGQIVISEGLLKTVSEIVPDILSFPEHDLVIEGHTDNIPIRAASGKRYKDNMELSFLRAKAVARVLADNGVPDERITVVSYGETRPIASNGTPEGRAKNRRVEIKLLSPEKGY